MNDLPQQGTKEYALARAVSTQNAMNGLYRKLDLPLEYEHLRKKDPLYITHVVGLADRVIREAVENGKNLDDPKVQEEIQAAVCGGAAGASAALVQHKFLRFLGIRR